MTDGWSDPVIFSNERAHNFSIEMESPMTLLLVLFKFFTTFSVLIIIFLSSASSSSPSPANAASELVHRVCKETETYAAKCQQVLGSDPRTRSVEDPRLLAEISLQLSVANAKDSLAFIKKIREEEEEEEEEAIIIQMRRCESFYEAAVASFRSALDELEEDPLTASYDVAVVADYALGCESALAQLGSRVVPHSSIISARNDQLVFFSRICFVVTTLLS